MEPIESACHRDYFYVGGSYVNDPSRPGEKVMEGQIYVEQLTPVAGAMQKYPLVFIHGAGQSGTVSFFLNVWGLQASIF